VLLSIALVASPGLAFAQETDITQTPNKAMAGIKKSLREQVGGGRGDLLTPNSSIMLIGRDPFRAIARGRQLFQRKFTVAQGFGPRTNDGIGSIGRHASLGAGLADSCASCHGRPQGSAGFGGVVFTRPSSRDAPHLFGLGLVEMIADEITAELRYIKAQAVSASFASGEPVSMRLVSKGVDYGVITASCGEYAHRGTLERCADDGHIDLSGVVGVDADLRVRPFFAEGGSFSIREFVVGAFNAEMGLESYDLDLQFASAGRRVTTPSGMVLDGSLDEFEAPPADDAAHDPDGDGVIGEVPASLVDYMEFYLLNYFRPAVRRESAEAWLEAGSGTWLDAGLPPASDGRKLFSRIGCAVCHVPDLVLEVDRRVADVDTVLDKRRGNPFNSLFATVEPLFYKARQDGSGYASVKAAVGAPFVVKNLFADFKRHDLGRNFWEQNFTGTWQQEFITEPLWGVGSTAPYGHDGRSPTLDDVILRHGGEAEGSRDAYELLDKPDRDAVLAFLGTLVLYSPPSTASSIGSRDVNAERYPMEGHGSIDLSQLFNNPRDKE